MESYLSAEDKARVEIDEMLEAAGWAVQGARDVNLTAARGVAVREFVLEPPHGRADYLLFVDREAVGVIEAKPEGATLTGVEWQSAKYLDGLPDWVTSALEGALPFAYQSTGVETRFTNTLDPEARSRQVFWFHRPETLAAWVRHVQENPLAPTLRHRLTHLPELNAEGLWPAQATAIRATRRLSFDAPLLSVGMAAERTAPTRPGSGGSQRTQAVVNRNSWSAFGNCRNDCRTTPAETPISAQPCGFSQHHQAPS